MNAWEQMADQILANAERGIEVPHRAELIRQLMSSFPEEADMASELVRVSTTDQIVRAAFMAGNYPVGIESFLASCREGVAIQ